MDERKELLAERGPGFLGIKGSVGLEMGKVRTTRSYGLGASHATGIPLG